MPFDRSQIRKGIFLTGGAFAASGELVDTRRRVRADAELAARHPEMSEVIRSAGVRPSMAKLDQLALERAELEQRLRNIRDRVESYRKRKPS